ncbi:MAG: glycine cleavage system aminomethyltransferase GcvT [Alicyclobacillus herbarius]|uniref:glycine cleavage system aminomethyltransferase GcvT n=1 Tax=Alicyclobacillus herbarius TaxID=122960 RepID=UPI002352219D|nr:glycine cleavage system aminomethyltransferase GcvT [Alicyclobacillus herbarius]MCL6631486.1 glycine cleavage system aminomethyltransferase GcvT [Alicyclobacillus herbarius]
MSSLKRTALYPLYARSGAKMVDFSGWEMPVQFDSILREHEAVRTRAGLFDVSHMGEFEVIGREAGLFLQSMLTNDVSRLVPGRALYSPMVYPNGGTVDDLLVYCLKENHYLVVVNAANIQKDFDWLHAYTGKYQVFVRDRSDEYALLAVQGPRSESILQPLVDREVSLAALRPFRFQYTSVAGVRVLISRTGYTGEDGFEIYAPAEHAGVLWQRILTDGQELGLVPCGLGARDTLRLEAALPLYGHELTADITPLQAGLDRFVKFDKGDFVGREALWQERQLGVPRRLVGLTLLERGIPRAHQPVVSLAGKPDADNDRPEVIGMTTSGTMSPTLKQGIALALVDTGYLSRGGAMGVDIRGRVAPAKVVELPFYRRQR